MNRQLTIKELAPYLHYSLKGFYDGENEGIELVLGVIKDEIITNEDQFPIKDFKPILRPLSDLTPEVLEELRINENYDTLLWGACDFKGNLTMSNQYCGDLTYNVLIWLFENHFDVFGLIDDGLAIDKNTLND